MTEQQIIDIKSDIAELIQEKINLQEQIDMIEKEIMDNILHLIENNTWQSKLKRL